MCSYCGVFWVFEVLGHDLMEMFYTCNGGVF